MFCFTTAACVEQYELQVNQAHLQNANVQNANVQNNLIQPLWCYFFAF